MHEKFSVFSSISISESTLTHLFIYKFLSGKILKNVSNGAEESTTFEGQRSG